MIDTVIFDMDGLLIDSEPLWGEAMREVLQEVGIQLTSELTQKTTGLRTNEVITYWYSQQPWKGKTVKEVEGSILLLVEEKILKNGEAMDGMNYILDFFKAQNFKIGLASSSPMQLIKSILCYLKIEHYFKAIQSAESELYGKPHPAVYLSCAKSLGSSPTQCIAFEDSLNGLIAAKAARMKTVAVPEAHKRNEPGFIIADIILQSLNDFGEQQLQLLGTL
jgi:mannitol-1-/sugar-/sorbitol-6-/2-deoxyglucose-6-phosphatase